MDKHNTLEKIKYLDTKESLLVIPLIINNNEKLLDLFQIMNMGMVRSLEDIDILSKINPLILSNSICTYCNFIDPFECSFDDFKKSLNDSHNILLPLSYHWIYDKFN